MGYLASNNPTMYGWSVSQPFLSRFLAVFSRSTPVSQQKTPGYIQFLWEMAILSCFCLCRYAAILRCAIDSAFDLQLFIRFAQGSVTLPA